MRGGFAWWDGLVGSLMPGHAATGSSPGQSGEIIVEDRAHPSTRHLGSTRWARADEWYNFATNVRGNAHVLLSMDESTYDPGGNADGLRPPDRLVQALRRRPRVRHRARPLRRALRPRRRCSQHLVGGVRYAAGVEAGDCGGTIDVELREGHARRQHERAVRPRRRARRPRLLHRARPRPDPRLGPADAQNVKTALTLDVYSGGEDGLLGITLDPDFADERLASTSYYAPDSPNNADPVELLQPGEALHRRRRTPSIDPASERLIIEVPASREPDEPGHTGGRLDFDLDGNLLLGVGDDVNPHSEPSGGYAPLSERPGNLHDARATSANTNDLRGKLLRITPGADGGYTIPAGNLFPGRGRDDKTRPEIYAMGFRNPFRFSVDPNTGWIGLADYAPDSGTDAPATRGPAGIVEYNLIKEPGNYGWPLCMGDNEPFRDVDYTTTPGHGRPVLRLREPGQRLDQEHRA